VEEEQIKTNKISTSSIEKKEYSVQRKNDGGIEDEMELKNKQ
jgi:hypothetical protein